MRILLIIFVLILPINAHAMLIEVDYTGYLNERIDLCGYGCGHVSSNAYVSDLKFAGGPAANNSVGYAQQFNIYKNTDIDFLLVSAHIASDLVPDGEKASNTMYFKLYSQTLTNFRGDPSLPFPNTSSMAILSPMYVETSNYYVYYPEFGFTHTFNQDGYYIDFPIPFDITLNPGTYWIAQERYPENTGGLPPYSGTGARQDRVDNISVKFSTVPEPATMFLVGGGLIGAFLRRRKINYPCQFLTKD